MSYSSFHTLAHAVFPHRAVVLADKVGLRLLAFTRAAPLQLRRPWCSPSCYGHHFFLRVRRFEKNDERKKIQNHTQNQCVDSNLLVCDVGRIMLIFGKTDAMASRTDRFVMSEQKEKTAM